MRARWGLCSLLSARSPGWWRNHHNVCFHDHFIFTWQVVHKPSSRKRGVPCFTFHWPKQITWRRQSSFGEGTYTPTHGEGRKLKMGDQSWRLLQQGKRAYSLGPCSYGVYVLWKMETDKKKNRNKTLLENKWDQFQNLINVMERIKQGDVIEWWGGSIWLVVREELSEKVASELGDEWQEPTMRWSWDRVLQRDPKITIFCCT